MRVLEVEIKNVYGNELIYPWGEYARAINRLTGKKTINHYDIKAIKELGFEVIEARKEIIK